MSVLTAEEAIKKASCYGTVEGKVTRIIERGSDGKRFGFEIAETIKAQSGASWERNWTIWQADTSVELDSHLIVTGDVSFKYDEYTGQDGTQRAKVIPQMNNPHIKTAFVEKTASTESTPF